MNNNYWEQTVYTVSPLRGLERRDSSAIFDWLSLRFPTCGSKIAWDRVQDRHLHWNITDDNQLAALASKEVCRRIAPGSVVEHVGDGLSPYAVCFTDTNAPSIVAALLEIPEHHYFVAEDRSWLAVITTEGDLDIVDQLNFESR
ncbi:hypothetical protein [Nonomuraea harbinensis]|uniref:MmcQ/YjbR family DNA-binding protein n=1 Tax=Nonomuraea harbinensis TaxID=1286938 RepID=A0ABW1BK38_9ACTN|nr:hypothetical protein [Nonomuraea harbinensis]